MGISRRDTLTLMPACLLATLPAAAANDLSGDERLLSLSAQLNAIDKQTDEICIAIENAEGVVWRPGCKHYMPTYLDDGTKLEHTAEYTRAREQAGLGTLDRADEELRQRLDATMATFAKVPATGMAGIAVKARLVVIELEIGDSAHGQDIAKSLIEDLDRLAPGPGMNSFYRLVAWDRLAGSPAG